MPVPHERATEPFKRGFRDCNNGRPKAHENDGTFYGHDYSEGWEACWNEQYWDAVRENKARSVL